MTTKTHFSGSDKTPEEAEECACHAAVQAIGTCISNGCMAWRWTPLSTRDPRWQEGMKTLIAEGHTNAKAAAAMLTPDVKKRFGVPLHPERGYCGLAGIPE